MQNTQNVERPLIVTLNGPVGSGKTTAGRLAAEILTGTFGIPCGTKCGADFGAGVAAKRRKRSAVARIWFWFIIASNVEEGALSSRRGR